MATKRKKPTPSEATLAAAKRWDEMPDDERTLLAKTVPPVAGPWSLETSNGEQCWFRRYTDLAGFHFLISMVHRVGDFWWVSTRKASAKDAFGMQETLAWEQVQAKSEQDAKDTADGISRKQGWALDNGEA
jgi:hypothetical protein